MIKRFIVLSLFSLLTLINAQPTLIHSFDGGINDGAYPYQNDLLQDGNTLYGMTPNGGANSYGTIFKVQTDGTGFTLLHSFAWTSSDGAYPYGSLIQDGSTLYGMTYYGGANSYGTIFKVQTDGTGFTLLHSFAWTSSEGAYPYGSLIQDGSTLYGMTANGGANTSGTIFKVQTDGTGFTLLHSFNSGLSTDGAYPYGSLIQDGSTLYGMTNGGGANTSGTIFKVQTDGTGFTLLHSLNSGLSTDGAYPQGSLMQDGDYLYGMTASGGEYGYGTIFKIKDDGTGFTILYSFKSGAFDGASPYGSLIQNGDYLYGMTTSGGVANNGGRNLIVQSDPAGIITNNRTLEKNGGGSGNGTIFRIKTDGSDFNILHSFLGPLTDGADPYGSLIMDGSNLYGMTYYGGANDYYGTLFSFPYTSPIATFDPKISGHITWSNGNPLANVNVAFSNQGPSATTDNDGYYEVFVSMGYTGTATPSAGNVDFTPVSIDYINVQSKQENQDYVGQPNVVEVSGTLLDANGNPIPDVALTFDDGLGKALAKTDGTIVATTDASGYFVTYLPLVWSGTVTPTKDGIAFSPSSYDFSTSGTTQSGLTFTSTLSSTLDVNDHLGSLPTSFTVLPAYPNPFNPSTTITYGLDSDSNVNISIYDITGQLITTLQNENQTQGWHSIKWNGMDNRNNQVPAGIYLSRTTSNNQVRTTKLMLLK